MRRQTRCKLVRRFRPLLVLLGATEVFAAAQPVPEAPKGKKLQPSAFKPIMEEDARTLRTFVDRWRPRLDAMTHARHRTMLDVVLGESLEHMHLFEQGAAGDEDLLGRRTSLADRVGAVLPNRWME